jgi:hypothetical protein
MNIKEDKTYKYATEEEAKRANKERALQRYYKHREKRIIYQREYHRKQ